MQSVAVRQTNEQHQITLSQSQVAVKTLLSASFGCILFLRSLLPEDNFGPTYLVVDDNNNSNDSSMIPSSQSSNRGGKASGYKIMTVKRGFSQEGDGILDYLEKGAFHALERQYLRRMVFALYIDEDDRQNIVESWNFDFSYQQIPGTTIKLPVLSMTDSLSHDHQSSKITSNDEIRSPTLGEVKSSIRNMVHKLIAITQTLEELPKKRYATFKLEYYPHTPEEYEPPLFVAGGPEREKMIFSTHDVNESPVRVSIGKVETGFNNVTLEVHSIAGSLPTADTSSDKMHVVGTSSVAGNTTSNDTNRTESNTLAEDASRRNIVWDADVGAASYAASQSVDGRTLGLLGQRMDDGRIVPVGKSIQGRPEAHVRHVDELDFSRPSDMDETQPNDSDPPAPIGIVARSSSTMQDTPMASPERPPAQSTHGEQDVAETLGRLNIAAVPTSPQDSQTQDEVMDLETQRVPASWNSDEYQEPPRSTVGNVQSHPGEKVDEQVDENIEVEVHCDCAVKEDSEDYDVCQCEGSCGRWIHLWCHGYHGRKDPRLPESFKCFECRLRATQASLILAESSIKEYVAKYGELALFRRALKVIEVENPGNTTEFRKLVGCTPQVATQLWKRLEREGFIGPEAVEEDGIGLFETRSAMHNKNGANKSKVRKTAKTKYTKNPSLVKMYAAYFDPSEEMERKHVGLGKKRRSGRTEQPENISGIQELENMHRQSKGRSPLSPRNSQRQPLNLSQGSGNGSYQEQGMSIESSKIEKAMAFQRPSALNGKRKADDRDIENSQGLTPLRRSKRVKISVPRKDIDLEW